MIHDGPKKRKTPGNGSPPPRLCSMKLMKCPVITSKSYTKHRQFDDASVCHATSEQIIAGREEEYEHPMRRLLPCGTKAFDAKLMVQPRSSNMTPTQVVYFDRFRNKLVFQLGSQSFDEFWCRSVLRESCHDEGVRDCVLALGALSQALEGTSNVVPLHEKAELTQSNDDYLEAMRYYARSLNRFRGQLATAGIKAVRRNVLISSILFSAFETLHGNNSSSDTLMTRGVLLLKDKILRSACGTQRSAIAAQCDDAGIEEAEFVLMRRLTIRSIFSSSPLLEEVANLITTCSFTYTTAPLPPAQDQHFDIFWKLWMKFFTILMMWATKVETKMYHNARIYDPPEHMLQEQQHIKGQIQAWKSAVDQKMATEYDAQGCQVLRKIVPGLKAAEIYIDTTFTDRDNLPANTIATVHEIFDLAELVLAETPIFQEGLGEVYDGIQCMTFGLGMRIRNQQLRVRAIALSRKLVKAQSRWDFKEIYMVFHALVELEEAGRNDRGLIPIDKRYRWKSSSWNCDYTSLHVYFELYKLVDGLNCVKQMCLRTQDFGIV